jgi:Arc/MetJ family transcription regulator
MGQLYDRAQLLAEVWAEPLTVIAHRYGLSNVGLAKLCTRLNIPRPAQGHWAKRAAGKPVPAVPALPAYTGSPSALRRPTRQATMDSAPPVDPRLAAVIAFEARAENRIRVVTSVQEWHPMVVAAQASLQRPRIDARGLPQTTAGTLDISVSPALLPRTLCVANALLQALEVRGYALSSGRQRIEVKVLGVALTVRFYEPTHRLDYQPTATERAEAAAGEAGYWPKWQFRPTGKLQLIVSDGFGGKVGDSRARSVDDQLNHVIVLMVTRAVEILLREERYAVEAAEREAVRQALVQRQQAQALEQARLAQLEDQALRWQRAVRLREYLVALEQHQGEDINAEQRSLLHWGRGMADWLDPLTPSTASILDEDSALMP